MTKKRPLVETIMQTPNSGSSTSDWASQTLKIVLQSLDAAVWVIDQESNEILFANSQAKDMFREPEGPAEACSVWTCRDLWVTPDTRIDTVEERKRDGRTYQVTKPGLKLAVQELDIDWFDGRKARLTIARDVSDIIRMEEALIESEARFRATLDNAAHAIVLTDDSGRFTQVNAAWVKMFGYTPEEAQNLTHLDVTHADFVDISREKLTAVLRGESDFYRIEKQYVRKDGSVFWGDLGVTPVHVLDRQVGAAVGVIADITESKKAQEALQERDALVNALYRRAAQAIASTDDQGRFIEVNPAFERMFGYTRSEALGMTHLDVTVPEFVDDSRDKATALFARELDSYRMEKRYVRKDGSTFWADLSLAAIHRPYNSMESVGIIVDISDRKKAEEALQKAHDRLEQRVSERTAELAQTNEQLKQEIAERARTQAALKDSEERFRAIFETAKDCIFIKDRRLRYTLVNPSMEHLLELPASEIMNSTDDDVYGPGPADYLNRLDLRVLSGEIIEAEHTRPVRGVPMTFLDIRAPMRNDRGEIVGICGISRNITERTKAVKEIGLDHVHSTVMRSTLAEARMAAKADIIILLTGESGAGKDHLASFIHDNSRRSSGPFYAINCAAIPPELAESELFGHEPGAFTGANRRKRGLLELAEGGTLLLNEIGELPLHLQAKLLTFLDSRSFTRVGGETPVTVSARLIAATNRNLEEEVAKNRFRVDLFYRLNVLTIRVPSLRERIKDLPTLAQLILAELEQELQLPKKAFISRDDMTRLCAYRWPGNVRELRNVLERALIVSPGPQLTFDSFKTDLQANNTPPCLSKSWTFHFPPLPSYSDAVVEFKRNLIQEALAVSGGNKQKACKLLGITRYVLRRQLESLKLNVPK